ncbi:MAG TPA: class I SAM-dependent methyltransferase, partial [Acetobacteraceae bacterium]
MALWDDGYVSDVDYTRHFYRETTPVWLATAALLLGQRAPDLTRPFRYADLGCAHGFTAVTVAATCPHAEVWGFDFNPSHIESARDLAARAGVTNVRFVETSFADLAAQPHADLPAFDFVVAHGVLSWISPENQHRLTEVIGQRLRPGGLAYLSYNVDTGWSGMAPLRTLMRMLTASGSDRTDQLVPAVLDYVDRLRAAGALFFPANPALESRLKSMREQDARYIAHEYLNQDWHPLMFADVSRAMADAKCAFIGSATLSENIDAVSVPPGVMPLLAEAGNRTMRETLRDFGANQVFRRDIYRRGVQTIPMAEQHARLDELRLAWTGQKAEGDVTIATPLGSLTGRPELYRPLLALMEAGPVSIRDARSRAPYAGRPLV